VKTYSWLYKDSQLTVSVSSLFLDQCYIPNSSSGIKPKCANPEDQNVSKMKVNQCQREGKKGLDLNMMFSIYV